jgi:hypothetical protein
MATPMETVSATASKINEAGARFMLHPESNALGAEVGFSHPFEFYCTGRGGVLGDVDADVVVSAFGYFAPGLVQRFWTSGCAVQPPRAAAQLFARSCTDWGRKHLATTKGLERLAELGEKVIDAAEPAALALFTGWRAEPLPDDGPGRAYQVLHVLREFRGSAHLVAVLAAGLTPFQAHAAKHGAEGAKQFGWKTEIVDIAGTAERIARAEDLTDELVAPAFASLNSTESDEFIALVDAAHADAAKAP